MYAQELWPINSLRAAVYMAAVCMAKSKFYDFDFAIVHQNFVQQLY